MSRNARGHCHQTLFFLPEFAFLVPRNSFMFIRYAIGHLRLPATVHSPAAKLLALLEGDHGPPLLLVDRIDVPAGLNAHATPGAPGRQAIHLRNVDLLASVELECGLGAECLEVDLGVGVVQTDELVQRLRARVDFDAGWIVVDDEAVVRRWGHGTESELLVCVELGVRLDGTRRDVFGVDDLVKVAGEGDTGALDRRTARDVEVAYRESSAKSLVSWEESTPAYLWLVTATTVSSTSSPTSSTSYSISRLVFSTPSTVSIEGKYQSLSSTVPGKPSSPSLLKYLNWTLSFPFLFTGVGPSKFCFPHPAAPPCNVLRPSFAVRS